ncbi:MAG TPA: amidohydrolase family protein, partial [Acidimicrobiales bacterium]|nr:amidohydrolase family protein [Acidimicrobiales bacterium]
LGHMGEMLPVMLARVDDIFASIDTGLARRPSEYFLANFHITTSGIFTIPPFLAALLVVGIDRMLFSVDYPYASNARGRAFLDAAPLDPADKEKLASGNAARLLGLGT